jgi:ribosomal protein L16/L10AE
MSIPKTIRTATGQDLEWLENGFDPDTIARQTQREIEAARQASPTPSHWRPSPEEGRPSD